MGNLSGPSLWSRRMLRRTAILFPVLTELERYFAAQARALRLSPLNLETADPEAVRAYCALVLNELAARGLLEQPTPRRGRLSPRSERQNSGCYDAPHSLAKRLCTEVWRMGHWPGMPGLFSRQGGRRISQEIWTDVLVYVRKNISEVEYHTWFAPVRAIGVESGALVLGVRNSFAQEWFRKHYLELLEDALRSLGAQNPQVSFQVMPAVQDAMMLPESPPPNLSPASSSGNNNNSSGSRAGHSGHQSSPAVQFVPPNLNPKYIFENFVVGPNNNRCGEKSKAREKKCIFFSEIIFGYVYL